MVLSAGVGVVEVLAGAGVVEVVAGAGVVEVLAGARVVSGGATVVSDTPHVIKLASVGVVQLKQT